MLHIKHKRSLFPSQALLFSSQRLLFFVTNVLLLSQTFFYRHKRSFTVTNVVLFRHKRCSFSSQTLLFFVTNVVVFHHKRSFSVTNVSLFRHTRSFSSQTLRLPDLNSSYFPNMVTSYTATTTPHRFCNCVINHSGARQL